MSATINWNSASKEYGTVDFNKDSDLVVTFYTRSTQDIARSQQEGAPIFNDKPYVKIFRPGEMMNVIDRPVQDTDKFRWRAQYEKYLLNQTQIPEGTPIDLLFPNNPAVADLLKSRGVYTIQQLSNLTAHAIDSIGMGGQDYVNRAKQYLKAAAGGQSVVAMQEDLKRKDGQIKTQTKQIEELQIQVKVLMAQMASKTQGSVTPEGTMQAPFVPGYDAQSERIAANHVTNAQKKK